MSQTKPLFSFLLLIFMFSFARSSSLIARNGFAKPIEYYDVHVYFQQNDGLSTRAALSLREDTIKLFPSIRVYDMVPRPIGPHPMGMFEAHLTNGVDFSNYVSWLCLNHNSYGAELSVLVHPNTTPSTRENGILDHSTRAIWIGQPLSLDFTVFNYVHYEL